MGCATEAREWVRTLRPRPEASHRQTDLVLASLQLPLASRQDDVLPIRRYLVFEARSHDIGPVTRARRPRVPRRTLVPRLVRVELPRLIGAGAAVPFTTGRSGTLATKVVLLDIGAKFPVAVLRSFTVHPSRLLVVFFDLVVRVWVADLGVCGRFREIRVEGGGLRAGFGAKRRRVPARLAATAPLGARTAAASIG